MSKSNIDIIEMYYTAVGNKKVEGIEKYLHPDVQFLAPLGKMEGKETVFEAIKKFTTLFTTLKIRTKFASGEEAILVYDLDCPAPIGMISTAALMTFKEGLITKIELFFDARPFDRKK